MTKFLFSISIILASLTFNSLAIAETVEVSGGGQCEGDITPNNLNGKVVCTYSNGDCEALSVGIALGVSLQTVRNRDRELILLPTVVSTREVLVMMRSLVKVSGLMLTAIATRESSRVDKPTDRGFISVLMADAMKDSLPTANHRDKGLLLILMATVVREQSVMVS